MDFDDPDLSSPRSAESPDRFSARLSMLRRSGPLLSDLPDSGFSIIIESDRRGDEATTLRSDYVIEFGDARLRVVLCPGDERPLERAGAITRLARYFLEVPDTDAVAVVADDASLSTWVLQVYDVAVPTPARPATSVRDAVLAFFHDNVLAVEFPDFRSVIELPSQALLENGLAQALERSFNKVASSRAVIHEKKVALSALNARDLRVLSEALARVLHHSTPTMADLLGTDNGASP